MNRETIEFEEELFDGVCLEDGLPEEYSWIEEKQTDFDSEKGFCYYDVIIQRKSDGKFFKGSYVNYGQGRTDIDLIWDEVFQKQTITNKYV